MIANRIKKNPNDNIFVLQSSRRHVPALLFFWHARRRPNRKRWDFHFRTRFFLSVNVSRLRSGTTRVLIPKETSSEMVLFRSSKFLRVFSRIRNPTRVETIFGRFIYFFTVYTPAAGGEAFPPSPIYRFRAISNPARPATNGRRRKRQNAFNNVPRVTVYTAHTFNVC